jgi:hypothetical protein
MLIRTQVQIEEDQIKWLRAKAMEKGVSVSQLIREGVALYRTQEEQIPDDKKKRALTAVGRFSSDASDVSVRHDDYLADAIRGNEDHDA